MIVLSNAFVLLNFLARNVFACGDDVSTGPTRQIITPPTRELEWKDINIIHTTDTHGWLLGHSKKTSSEPNYSGTLGDFSSFVSHMKNLAIEKDVDLLLVDSGDLHHGPGLADGLSVTSLDASSALNFFKKLPYDVMAIGNHELYSYDDTLYMNKNFAPALQGRYVTSNVNITIPDASGVSISTPVGSRFAKFKTRKGRSVTSFGVLFNFKGNDHGTIVQEVADMVKEQWFRDAIQEEPDLFLLVGHMPLQKDNWPLVFDAIRAMHPNTPILIFGGHSHIRDCLQLDKRSMSLQSGRYMETVGWMSASLGGENQTSDMVFSRRYLDPNLLTYKFHTRRDCGTFETPHGTEITAGLQKLYKESGLDAVSGTAPQDYFLNRAPYPSSASVLSLFVENAVPTVLGQNSSRASVPSFSIISSGSLRFDLFSGPFTKDDQLAINPYANKFMFIPDIPAGIANKVVPILNGDPGKAKRGLTEEEETLTKRREDYARGLVDREFNDWLSKMYKRDGKRKREDTGLTPGYVTSDSCPGVGDDTLHAPLPFYDSPNYIGTVPPKVSDDALVDVVFADITANQVVKILNELLPGKNFTADNLQQYTPVLTYQVLGEYAKSKWN